MKEYVIYQIIDHFMIVQKSTVEANSPRATPAAICHRWSSPWHWEIRTAGARNALQNWILFKSKTTMIS